MWLEEWGGKIKKEFIRIKGLNMFCPSFIYGVDFYRANTIGIDESYLHLIKGEE